MYGIGILGLGIMGRRVAHAIADHPALNFVAGFDPNSRADLLGVAPNAEPNSVIADPRVDCVYIASPPSSHLDLVSAVAKAGKAIFCEKPLAVSVGEARACVECVRASGVVAAVNFPFALAPSSVRLRQIVSAGELGKVETARLTLRFASWPRGWQTDASGWLAGVEQGGFTREVISHFLFLANRMFGPASLGDVQLRRAQPGTEAALFADIVYDKINLKIDAAVSGDVEDYNRFELNGTRGQAALTDWYRLETEGLASERTPPMPHQLDALARMLGGDNEHGLATFEEAATVVELVEGILTRNQPS